MRLVYLNIHLSNPVKPDFMPLKVKCLVDTRSTYLCITSDIATQLGLHTLETRKATITNGQSEQCLM